MHILIVEDDIALRDNLASILEDNGYIVDISFDLETTAYLISKRTIDLVILDVMLKETNGFYLYQHIIKPKKIATLFLSASDTEENIVHGLEIGAEDYITKPFSTKELLVRINKIILRIKKNNVLCVEDISFDFDKWCCYKDGKIVNLTALEMKILGLLFSNINRVVTRNMIIDYIWQITGNDIEDNTLTVYLKRIREKLDTNIIKTIKKVGYRIDEK